MQGAALRAFLQHARTGFPFPVLLDTLRREKALSPIALYKGAWIDRRHYSKIMGERNYHPAKNTVIAFGLSLQLRLDEMQALLASAGFTLSRSITADVIVMFCIARRLYDLHTVNDLLFAAGEKPLCGA
jgi:hypothetical protein